MDNIKYYAVTQENMQYLQVVQQAYISSLKTEHAQLAKRLDVIEDEIVKAQSVRFFQVDSENDVNLPL